MKLGDWKVDVDQRTLQRGEDLYRPTPRAWEVLSFLLDRAGQLVTTEDLLARFWRGPLSEDSAVRKAISEIRHGLADSSSEPRYIKTVPKKGYVLTADVQPPSSACRAIAVLPFVNMSGDPAQEYFSDGISEEVLNALVGRTRLPVIARTSSFQFKDLQHSTREIAERLGAAYIVQGSVRQSAKRLRITAQLVEPTTSYYMWTQSYDRELADVLELQTDIARSVAVAVENQVGGQYVASVAPVGSHHTSMQAYDMYLYAGSLLRSGDPASAEAGVEAFQKCVAMDPNFEAGWLGLAWGYIWLSDNQIAVRTPAEVYPLAEAAALRVLELNEHNQSARGLLGWIRICLHYSLREGFDMMERAIAASDASDPNLLALFAYVLRCIDDPRAEWAFTRSHQLNPMDPFIVFNFAIYRLFRGEQVEAIRLIETLMVQQEQHYAHHFFVGLLNAFVGRFQAAAPHLTRARSLVGDDHPGVRVLEYYVALNKDIANQERLLQLIERLGERMKSEYVPLLVTMGWPGHLVERAWRTAIDQRHTTVLQYACADKPSQMSQEFWDYVHTIIPVAELTSGRRDYLRAAIDRAELIASQMLLSDEELDRCAGTYARDATEELLIERRGRELWAIYSDSGEYHQLVPTSKTRFGFYGFYRTLDFDPGKGPAPAILESDGTETRMWQRTS